MKAKGFFVCQRCQIFMFLASVSASVNPPSPRLIYLTDFAAGLPSFSPPEASFVCATKAAGCTCVVPTSEYSYRSYLPLQSERSAESGKSAICLCLCLCLCFHCFSLATCTLAGKKVSSFGFVVGRNCGSGKHSAIKFS